MDLVPATMLTSVTPMPPATPAVSRAGAGDFAALLAPMTAQDAENTPAQSQAAAPQDDGNDSGQSMTGSSSRTTAKSGGTKRQDQQHRASSQGSAAQPVPAPAAQQATSPAASVVKVDGAAASSDITTKNSLPDKPSGLQAKPQIPDGPAVTSFKADDESVGTDSAKASVIEAMNALQAGGAAPVKADADAPKAPHPEGAKQQATNQVGTQPIQMPVKTAQPVEGTARQAAEVLPAAGTALNPATQEHAAKDAVNTAVKSAVSQAAMQPGKEAAIKPVSGHVSSSKLPGTTQIAGAHAPVKSAGETGGNEHNTNSGQNSAKKNNEFKPAKGTEFTAQADATTAKPAVHDAGDSTVRVSTDPSASPADAKQPSGPTDTAPLPANPQAAAAAAEAANNEFAQPASLVHSTSLLNEAGRSEMKVGMRVGDFGNVEIRTQMRDSQLKAEISVEHRDLGHILTNDLPALQQKLQQSDFSMASVTVRHEGALAGGFQGESRGQQQFYPAHQAGGSAMSQIESVLSAEEVREGNGGLDIRI